MLAGPPEPPPAPLPPRLPVPAPVREIAETLERAGFETWCVGGAVRDALLGHPHLDWDLATQATPWQIRNSFRRTIPVGIEHGTIGVLDRDGRMHEVTTFRKDVQTDGRHAKVEFGASLDEDLARRDFTINAIAYHPTRGEIRDPFGGREDLARRLVRAVGVAEERMREDRLRALRAIRFASRFGFEIEPATWEAIAGSAPHLRRLSAERVKQELEKTMEQVPRPGLAIRRWLASGAMAALVPALATMPEELTVALDFLPRPGSRRPEVAEGRKKNCLAALFFASSASRASAALKELRFSNSDVAWISSLVAAWQELGREITAAMLRPEPPTDGEIRRWAARAGRTRLGPLLRIAAALWNARRTIGLEPAPPASRVASVFRRALRIAYRDPIELRDLAVNGNDLESAGVPSGPELGKILRTMLDRVLDDPTLNTRDRLLDLARSILRDGGGSGPSRT